MSDPLNEPTGHDADYFRKGVIDMKIKQNDEIARKVAEQMQERFALADCELPQAEAIVTAAYAPLYELIEDTHKVLDSLGAPRFNEMNQEVSLWRRVELLSQRTKWKRE